MTAPEIPELPDDVRALVKRVAKAATPATPADARERVRARVDAIASRFSGGGGSGPSGEPPRIPGASSGWTRVIPLAVSFALGSAVGALAMRAWAPVSAPQRASNEVAPAPIERPPPTPSRAEAPVPVDEIPAAPAPMATPVRSAAKEAPVRPPPGPAPSGERNAFVEERAVLDVARRAIEGGDGDAALLALARHERRYPSGILAQERDAMTVRALLLLGKTAEARVHADRFGERFPDSALLPSVRAAVEAAPSQ